MLDVAVVLLTLVCFWPLVRFFFAQDDFPLIEQATRGLREAVGGFFTDRPGQFRPLTKGLYFVAAWPLFGLNPVAYHVTSILLHAANALLLGALLRRMGFSSATSRFVAALFAFNVAFMEAIAWISCVQQLIGSAFMLLALVFGIDALENRARGRRVASALALVLALSSYEQTLAAPAVLFGWYAMRRGLRALPGAVRRFWEQPAILVLYLGFTLGVRGVPDSGPYVMSVGAHVLDNLREYTGIACALWMVFPSYGLPDGFTVSHAVLIVLTGFLVFRRRLKEIAFGLGTFLALLAPVLFTRDHTHSFHLYVPAVGVWFLAAVAMDELLALVPAAARKPARTLMAGVAVVVFTGSTLALRENTMATLSESVPLARSFVLRRAVLAERMLNDIGVRTRLKGRPGRMVLLYQQPQYVANWRNVYSALGEGSAVRLYLGSPDLEVQFVPPLDIPLPDDPDVEVMVYSELGRCYTAAEVADAQRRRAASQGRSPVTPGDTTSVVAPAE